MKGFIQRHIHGSWRFSYLFVVRVFPPWRVLCVCALNSDWLSNYFCFGGIVYDTQYWNALKNSIVRKMSVSGRKKTEKWPGSTRNVCYIWRSIVKPDFQRLSSNELSNGHQGLFFLKAFFFQRQKLPRSRVSNVFLTQFAFVNDSHSPK